MKIELLILKMYIVTSGNAIADIKIAIVRPTSRNPVPDIYLYSF